MSFDRRPSMVDVALWTAKFLAERSTCKRAQCGAVVLDPTGLCFTGLGYNGQPRLLPNDGCNEQEGTCGCVHAEVNAVLKSGWSPGATLCCTHLPCPMCARLIINAGISTLYAIKPYRDLGGIPVMKAAGIRVFLGDVEIAKVNFHGGRWHTEDVTGKWTELPA